MDILKRIDELSKQRGWSTNNLAMEAGLTQSTLSSMKNRNTSPTLYTVEAICTAFGLTLSQFFLEDEQTEILTAEEKEMLVKFRTLSAEQKSALLKLL